MRSIDLCPEEGGGTIDLFPNGRDVEVTITNVYDYVRKYAEYRMYKAQRKALEVIASFYMPLIFFYKLLIIYFERRRRKNVLSRYIK